jgi:DNA replicative helicase MCM subunit Mcm2 (Cdc46/Mcm family)
MTNNTNTINWEDIDKAIRFMKYGFSSSHWDKEAGTYTVQQVIPIPRASIRSKVVRVIKDALDEALDAVAEHVSTNTIAKMTYDCVVEMPAVSWCSWLRPPTR